MRGRIRLKCDDTRAETRFKWTRPFKSAGASVQSTAGSQVVRISGSKAGYTTFRGSVRVLATHSIRQFPLHFPSRASPCAIRFQTHSNTSSCSINWVSVTAMNRVPTWGFHVHVIGGYSWLKEHNRRRHYKVTTGHDRVFHIVFDSRLVNILDLVLGAV